MSGIGEGEPPVDDSGLIHCLLGPDGHLRWRNPAAVRLGSSAHATPRMLADLFHPEDRTTIIIMLDEARETGRAVGTVRVHDPRTGALRHFQLILIAETASLPATAAVHPAGPRENSIDLRGAGGDPLGYLAQAWDVTFFVRRQQQLEVHAFRDGLTGIANRRSFMTRLDQDLALCRRRSAPLAVLFADIDHFKTVNDTHGHATGDQVLVTLATRLAASLRVEDTLGRIGGDEFAVICPNLSGWPAACTIVDRLRTTAAVAIPTATAQVQISVSIGVAFAEETHTGTDAAAHLVALADSRMFRIKFADRQPVEP